MDNIFKSWQDAVGYIVFYIIFPAAQTYVYVDKKDGALLFYLSIFLASIIYDAYTRGCDELSEKGAKKITTIKWVCGILVVFNCIIGFLVSGGSTVNNNWFFIYLILSGPLIIAVSEFYDYKKLPKKSKYSGKHVK